MKTAGLIFIPSETAEWPYGVSLGIPSETAEWPYGVPLGIDGETLIKAGDHA